MRRKRIVHSNSEAEEISSCSNKNDKIINLFTPGGMTRGGEDPLVMKPEVRGPNKKIKNTKTLTPGSMTRGGEDPLVIMPEVRGPNKKKLKIQKL